MRNLYHSLLNIESYLKQLTFSALLFKHPFPLRPTPTTQIP